jgi:type III restriction enzyme
MDKVVIENPVINSPYEEPARHFKFTDEGITDEIVEARRISAYFVPVPRPKKKGAQREFETEATGGLRKPLKNSWSTGRPPNGTSPCSSVK